MSLRALIGYDGSPAANGAIDACAQLFPRATVWITHLWTPPFASDSLRQRLWSEAGHVNEFIEAIEREGEQEAHRLVHIGVTLASAAGLTAQPLVLRSYGGEGLRFTELAQKVDADVVAVGSRGLGGAQSVLGSVSDLVVRYTPRPVLVVPHPLLMAEHSALAAGPVVVGFDGSAGAKAALATAGRLFPTRRLLQVTVDDGHTPDDETAGAPHDVDPNVTRLRVPSGRGAPGRAVAAALVGCARSEAAAVIVVGSRGRSAVREILLGSVAMATLHNAHRPVLVVPGAADKPR